MKDLIRVENANCDNGEIMQIPTTPAVAQVCHHHDSPSQPAADDTSEHLDLGGESPCFAHLLDDSNPGA